MAGLGVIGEALALLLLPNHYPKLLVLEVGADRPGDLAGILRIAMPDAVVVTRLPEVPVHVEAYASPQAVREEEFAPAYALAAGAPLVISADDAYACSMAERLAANVITVGYAQSADFRMGEPVLSSLEGELRMEASLTNCGTSHPLSIEGALGRSQMYAPAMALALATSFGLTPAEALEGLTHYAPPPGRARVLAGIKGSVLIDDSYNASPAAVEEALGALASVPGTHRRIAVLGDMLELGRYSVAEHERMGNLAAEKADMLIAVGSRMQAARTAAIAAGLSEQQALAYDTAQDAALALVQMVGEGDAILIKGSQSVRMERIVLALLATPADAGKLVRQDREWRRR